MPSAFIPSALRFPAVPLARQQLHQWCVHSGPLVLGAAPLMCPTPTMDRDRTVSRRSEPSSRAALIGEQPNPWDLLQPQDATSRHRGANLPVDVDSWGRSACYPRGSFYPLSDGNSTLYRRITKSYFRTCSTCRSRSQAPFCLYALGMVSIHSEGTFEAPPLPFRRRPPQSNCPPDTVLLPAYGPWLEFQ